MVSLVYTSQDISRKLETMWVSNVYPQAFTLGWWQSDDAKRITPERRCSHLMLPKRRGTPLQWKLRVLITGPPGNSLRVFQMIIEHFLIRN